MDAHQHAAAQAAKTLLENLSPEEVSVLGIQALRRWWRRPPPPTDRYRVGAPPPPDPLTDVSRKIFQVHADLGVEFARVLLERKPIQNVDPDQAKEAFINDEVLNTDWMSGFVEFLWWLIRAGIAVELRRDRRDPFSLRDYPTTLRVTERGARVLDDPDSDNNPMVPGFLDRIRLRCPDLPDGVLALLADGRACLDVGLLRPAVVMMGVAYELAIESVIDILITKQLLPSSILDGQAAARLRAVRQFLRTPDFEQLITDREQRRRITEAYDFAEQLRHRRNDAAHTQPAYDFSHTSETAEYFVSAGRYLATLWSLGQ